MPCKCHLIPTLQAIGASPDVIAMARRVATREGSPSALAAHLLIEERYIFPKLPADAVEVLLSQHSVIRTWLDQGLMPPPAYLEKHTHLENAYFKGIPKLRQPEMGQ